jgi:hypothetical protein
LDDRFRQPLPVSIAGPLGDQGWATKRSNSMRLSNLSSWWNERLQARDARRATDAERSEELLALLDEASSIRRRRS